MKVGAHALGKGSICPFFVTLTRYISMCIIDHDRDFEFMFNTKDSNKWRDLVQFILVARSSGITEFRLAFNGDKAIIIHPLNKDGKTLDIELFRS